MSDRLTSSTLRESLNVYFDEIDTNKDTSNHHLHVSVLGNGESMYLMVKSEIPDATKRDPERRRTAWWSMVIKGDVYKRFLSYMKATEKGDKDDKA